VLVSRPYQEAVTRLSPEHVALFSYLGSRTDKHVREHEVYVVSAPVAQVQELAARRKRQRSSHAKPTAEQAKSGSRISRGLAWGFFSMAAAGLAVAAYFSLTSGAAPAPAALPASPPRAMIAPSRPVEPQPPAPDPSTVTAEPPIAAQPQPPAVPISAAAEPPKPEPTPPARMAPPRAKTKPGGSSEPTPQAVAAMPAQVEHKPEPELIQPGPKPDTVPESQPEQAASKPATLPTQYRATAGPTALVVLAISPWGEVLVDGKMVGVSPPMAELELSPGKHTIEVRNGPFKPYQTDVDLGPNETTRIKHKFLQGR
jgi:serine/threonine-protein kinase